MDAQAIIAHLESQGISLKDIHELSGVGLSSLYAIKNGERSGETSLPALQRLLNSSQAYVTLPSPSPSLPGPIVESTVASIDNHPVTRSSRSRAIQPYVASIPSLPDHQAARGQSYKQSRNRYDVTPDDMMSEIQGLRFQLNEMAHRLDQQQKQQVRQAKKEDYQGPASTLTLIAEGAKLAYEIYSDNKRASQESPIYPQLPAPTYRRDRPTPTYREQLQSLPTPTYAHQPTIQPYRPNRRAGIYGSRPGDLVEQVEREPSTWARFKKFLGF